MTPDPALAQESQDAYAVAFEAGQPLEQTIEEDMRLAKDLKKLSELATSISRQMALRYARTGQLARQTVAFQDSLNRVIASDNYTPQPGDLDHYLEPPLWRMLSKQKAVQS